LHLVAGSAGNLSARLEENKILVTATQTELGALKESDILKIDLDHNREANKVTTEFPLHKLIYKNFPAQVVIHCHPVFTNGYFAVYSDIKLLTFESKLYLGNIPVVEQDTPAVTRPEQVVEVLKTSNLVVLKNHGVVAMGEIFKGAFNLIETLEEAVKVAATARLFKKEILDDLDRELKARLESEKVYVMFSPEHIQAIVDLVNQDAFIQEKGKELDLTLQYAIKLDGADKVYKFIFEKGRIVKLDFDDQAPFVASAPAAVWELIFLGRLDPFVAVTQGKMRLQGQLGQLAKWYVPFNRLFQLFKEVPIR
jgi:L-fuculose-phosphate aldolase